jgi:outer membrane receptor protein involved in Fe transport
MARAALVAAAEPTTAAPVARDMPTEPARVEVKAKAEDYDPRRDDTAAKIVIRQDEIMKYGDTSVYDVLKRAPGITIVDNTIRLRGLGSYTQVLVNGQRPPPGFSLDAVAPDQIERIEIIHGASAEYSMQAIAGTVNIVLKQTVRKQDRNLRLSTSGASDKRVQFATAALAGKGDHLDWIVNGMAQHAHLLQQTLQTDRYTPLGGSVAQLRDSSGRTDLGNQAASLQPRLTWKISADDQLSLGGFFQGMRGSSDHATSTANRIGVFPAPEYVHILGRRDFYTRFSNLEVNWISKLWGGKLDAKANLTKARLHSQAEWLSATADDAIRLRRRNIDERDSWRSGSSGKYTRSLDNGHALAAGWEFSRDGTRDDNHRNEGFVGADPADIPERFDPQVRQFAAFVQDEWNLTQQWSMYLGARRERIRMESAATGLLDTVSDTHVLTPVAQTLYKFPDKSGRQLRLAFTHTFRTPTQSQLSARRDHADLNTRFQPDQSGNPLLRPELARGADLTYEQFWAPGAVYSLGASVRHIRDLIRTTLGQDADGSWVVRPINQGNAEVRTLEFDARFPLKAVLRDGAPPVDLRVNLSRNWSSVDAVPGPGNRLDQQIPFSALFGADYKTGPLGLGLNVAYRAGGDVRGSEQQTIRMQTRRDVDAYVQYAPRKGVDLRLAVTNALGEDVLGYSRYQDAGGITETWERRRASPEVRLNLSVKY